MIITIRRIAYAYVWNFDISNRIFLFEITYKFAQRNLCILIIVLLSVNALRLGNWTLQMKKMEFTYTKF